ncbi:MAG: F-box domain-containing protein [Pseudomonas sp.]|nr:F-box domain-containing protein [Pseudomonas sp.]
MLNAILAGKKRGTGLQGQTLAAESAEGAEDVLTATLFERLAYLPDEHFCAVMSDLLGESFGPLQEIQYWPSWSLPDGTRVEPDVVLFDGYRTVVVEAKRLDNVRQQNAAQLSNELLAGWYLELLEDGCILLALGGLESALDKAEQQLQGALRQRFLTDKAKPYKLVCKSWQALYQILQLHIQPESSNNNQRLLDDLSACYAWHGLRTHEQRWLKDLHPASITTSPTAFAAWSMK